MKLDLTGLTDDGGFVNLNPGRYSVVTKDKWSAKKSKAGNLILRVPFTVLDKGEFDGAGNSYFHTIMLDGEASKMRTNKIFTLRLLTCLGIIMEDDRGAKGELGIEFEFGDKDDKDNVEVHSIMVNNQRRGLGGRHATAVVVIDNERDSGVNVKNLEANGKPNTDVSTPSAPAVVAQQPEVAQPKATGGFPF